MIKPEKEANEEYWFGIVRDFLASNKDRYDYCKEHKLDQNRLIYWLGRQHANGRELVSTSYRHYIC